jgi:multidrug efflux pump
VVILTWKALSERLNVKKEFTSADQIANLTVKTPTGQSVYLRDIAEVKDSFKEQNSYASLYRQKCNYAKC